MLTDSHLDTLINLTMSQEIEKRDSQDLNMALIELRWRRDNPAPTYGCLFASVYIAALSATIYFLFFAPVG